jgi:hypothetical protein
MATNVDAKYRIGFELESKDFIAGLKAIEAEFRKAAGGIGLGQLPGAKGAQPIKSPQDVRQFAAAFLAEGKKLQAGLKGTPAELRKFEKALDAAYKAILHGASRFQGRITAAKGAATDKGVLYDEAATILAAGKTARESALNFFAKAGFNSIGEAPSGKRPGLGGYDHPQAAYRERLDEERNAAREAIKAKKYEALSIRQNANKERELYALKAQEVAAEADTLRAQRQIAKETFNQSELAKQGTLFQRFQARRHAARTGEVVSPLSQQTAGGLVGNALITTGKYAAAGALTYGLVSKIGAATRSAIDFQRELKILESQFETVGATGEESFGDVRNSILEISSSVGETAQKTALTYRQLAPLYEGEKERLAQQGLTPKQATDDATKTALQFSKVTGLPIEEINDSLTSLKVTFDKIDLRPFLDQLVFLEAEEAVLARETVKFTANIAPAAKELGFTFYQLANVGTVLQQVSGMTGDVLSEQFQRVLVSLKDKSDKIFDIYERNPLLSGSLPKITAKYSENDISGVIEQMLTDVARLRKEAPEAAEGIVQKLNFTLGGNRQGGTIGALFKDAQKSLDAFKGKDIDPRAVGGLQTRYEKVSESIGQQLDKVRESFGNLFAFLATSGLGDGLALILRFAATLLRYLHNILKFGEDIGKKFGGWPFKIASAAAGLFGIIKLLKYIRTLVAQQGAINLLSALPGLGGLGKFGRAAGPVAAISGTDAAAVSALGGRAVGGMSIGASEAALGGTVVAMGRLEKAMQLVRNAGYRLLQMYGNTAFFIRNLVTSTKALLGRTVLPVLQSVTASFTAAGAIAGAAAVGVTAAGAGAVLGVRDFVAEGGQIPLLGRLEAFQQAKGGVRGQSDIFRTEIRSWSDAQLAQEEKNRSGFFTRLEEGFSKFIFGRSSSNDLDRERDRRDAAAAAPGLSRRLTQGAAAFDKDDISDALKVESYNYGDNYNRKDFDTIKEIVAKVKKGDKRAIRIAKELLKGKFKNDKEFQELIDAMDASAEDQKAIAAAAAAVSYETIKRRLNEGRPGTSLEDLKTAAQKHSKALKDAIPKDPNAVGYDEAVEAYEQAVAEENNAVFEYLNRMADRAARLARARNQEGGGLLGQIRSIRQRLSDSSYGTPDQRADMELQILEAQKQYDDALREGGYSERAAEFESTGNTVAAAQERQRQIEDQIRRVKAAGDENGELPGLTAQLIQAKVTVRNTSLALFNAEMDLYVAMAGGDPVISAQAAIDKAVRAQRDLDPKSEEYLNQQAIIETQTRTKAAASAAERNAERVLASVRSGDPLSAAQAELDDADEAVRLAAPGIQKLEAERRRVEAQRTIAETIAAIGQAQADLLIAYANAAGDSVLASQLAAKKAQDALTAYQAAHPGSNAGNDPQISTLQAAVVDANAAARDATQADAEANIDFLLQMDKISEATAISMYQQLLDNADVVGLTKKQREALQLKIKGLRDALGADMHFNLPADIRLPTLYEARRLNQTTSGAYQDNRNVTINLTANNTVDAQGALDVMVDTLSGPSRFGSRPRTY